MHLSSRLQVGLLVLLVTLLAVTGAFTLNSVFQPHVTQAANASPLWNAFHFNLTPSPNITSCLPKASGSATITRGQLNDQLTVQVKGLAPKTGYDLFVIELPNKPFGVSWYQSDLETDSHGNGSVNVRGIFNVETFSVSPGDNSATPIVFPPTHQYHLGLWFNDPTVPFNLGCEPGATSPIVTPFNGEQNAGIQVLNTSSFPDTAGPLSHVKP